MKFHLVLAAVFAVAAANPGKSFFRGQEGGENTDVILDHVQLGSKSSVKVTCGLDGTVKLDLTIAPAVLDGDATFSIGTGIDGAPTTGPCASEAQSYSATPTISTTVANTCGRVTLARPEGAVHIWEVNVVENLPGDGNILYRQESSFKVTCRAALTDTGIVPDLLAPVLDEGSALFDGEIKFTLTRDTSASNARLWVLVLKPEDPNALAGLSYRINNLIASTEGSDGAAGPTLNIIENGCVKDRGTRVDTTVDTTNTIRVTPFRFRNNNNGVDFKATTVVCNPATPGGVCQAVKTVAECTAPVPDPNPVVPDPVVPDPVIPDPDPVVPDPVVPDPDPVVPDPDPVAVVDGGAKAVPAAKFLKEISRKTQRLPRSINSNLGRLTAATLKKL